MIILHRPAGSGIRRRAAQTRSRSCWWGRIGHHQQRHSWRGAPAAATVAVRARQAAGQPRRRGGVAGQLKCGLRAVGGPDTAWCCPRRHRSEESLGEVKDPGPDGAARALRAGLSDQTNQHRRATSAEGVAQPSCRRRL